MNHHRHYGIRPVGRPIELRVCVSKATDRGVQVRLVDGHDQGLFWLPAGYPAQWLARPEIGEVTTVRLPRWLASKHQRIVELRTGTQRSLNFYSPPPLDTGVANKQGSFPMSHDDRPQDAGKGALFKNAKKEKPSHPDYRGDCEIKGRKFWVSGWIKKSEKTGETYMSLALREAEQRPVEPRQEQGGGRMPVEDPIPSGPDR